MDSMNTGNSDMFERVFRRKEEIVSRKIAGETLLVPIMGKLADMQRIFSLNSLGEYIWHQLDGEKSLGDIRDGILTAFDADKEQADADTREFIAELLKEDLIVRVN